MGIPRNVLRVSVKELEKRIEEQEGEIAALIVRCEHRMLDEGKAQAKVGVLMQAMAWLARNEPHLADRVKTWVAEADKASLNVKVEDFVVPRLNGTHRSTDSKVT